MGANLLQAIRLFQFSFLHVKTVNHFEGYVNYQDIENQLQGNILYHFRHYNFL